MTNGNQILEDAISKWREEMYLAFKRALEEQRTCEPCEDAISRQAALKLFATHDGKYLFEAIRDLPSVTPKQTEITLESAIDYLHSIGWMQKHDKEMTECAERAGHWIETADEYYKSVNEYGGGVDENTPYFTDNIGCSVCLAMFSTIDNETERFNYCPNCGAKMESEER